MSPNLIPKSFAVAAAILVSQWSGLQADDSAIGLSITNGVKKLQLPIVPGTDKFRILSTPSLDQGFTPATSGVIQGFEWTDLVQGGSGFYRVETIPLTPSDILPGVVLNRLAYGQTPDELERVRSIGGDAFIQEQLAPEGIAESLAIDKSIQPSGWQFVTTTGIATSADLYVYLTGVGDIFIDDLRMVEGSVAEQGTNLVKNGDFETALSTANWTVSTNLTDSALDATQVKSGASSLHIVSTAAGSSKASSIWQTVPGVTVGKAYTLSYWFNPGATKPIADLRVRLSGSGIVSSPLSGRARLEYGVALLNDLRAWHIQRAVQSKRQLLEVLTQFLENHFVTQVTKSRDFFDRFFDDGTLTDQISTLLEFKENQKWRASLMTPECTFSNLLTISAESPAMIIYLDTVDSKGNGKNIANENYAREILELFTMGVDNGYDQADITTLSRAWTGWSVDVVNSTNEFNPLAPRSTNLITASTNTSTSNLFGVWSFRYKSENHNTNSKTIFPAKTVPARFGAPYAGRSYQLAIPARTPVAGLQDGYDVLAHLANLPFTQEFICVKLCRLLVHEGFETGYDFTDPNLSEEGQLIRTCMHAWEDNLPKGQMRKVLGAIFASDLFRSQRGAAQKVKTPLEYTVATFRALRSVNQDGTSTAEADSSSIPTVLNRMGGMRLFDRAEPDGFTEAAPGWISAGTLAERLRFVQGVCMPTNMTGKADVGLNNLVDPVGLLKKKLPAADLLNADKVANYLVDLFYPTEGRANLDIYARMVVRFLDTDDDGVTSKPLANLTVASSPYDLRVRGAVAMLLSQPRFQEQ